MKKGYCLLFTALFALSFALQGQTTVGDITITYTIEPAHPAVDSFFLVEVLQSSTVAGGARRSEITTPVFFSDTTDLNTYIEKMVNDSLGLLDKINYLQTQLTIIHAKAEAIRTAKTAAFMQVLYLPPIYERRPPQRAINRKRWLKICNHG